MKYLFLFIVSLFTLNCQSQKASTAFETITFSRSACRGFCPAYELTVQKNGDAVLNGERFFFDKMLKKDEPGIYHTTLNSATLQKIEKALQNFKKDDLKKEYKDTKTDVSGFTIDVKFKDGTTKNVYVYGSYKIESVKALFSELDALRNTQTWKK